MLPALLLTATLVFAQAPAPPGKQPDPPTITDPAVQSVLESDPQSPPELFRAMLTLINLGYPDLAEPMLTALTEANLDDDALADLGEAFGTPAMFRLARVEPLNPTASELALRIMEAVDQRTRDPARLAELVEQLTATAPGLRRAAIIDLRQAKVTAVTYLLGRLVRESNEQVRFALRNALIELGEMSIGPLVGALESEDDRFKMDVVAALGLLDADRATLQLAGLAVAADDPQLRETAGHALRAMTGAVPSPEVAARAIYRRMRRYLAGERPFRPDHEGMVTLWHWDNEAQQSVAQRYPADDAGIVLAAQLGRELHRIEPENPAYRRLYFVAILEAAKLRFGFDRPLPAGDGTAMSIVSAAGSAVVSDLLEYALEHEHYGTAAAAADILGDVGNELLLFAVAGRPSPLAAAAASRDRRVRFSAVRAILAIAPQRPFAGASKVGEALAFFAATSGDRRIAIGHVKPSAARNVAGMAAALGYDGVAASTGRDLVLLAKTTPDVELILVHSGIDRFDVREVLYQLRRDERTARLPVGIIAALDGLPAAKRLAAEHRLAEAFPQPHEVDALAGEVGELLERAGRSHVSVEERMRQAVAALGWIEQLAAAEHAIYDLTRLAPAVETALQVPELTVPAARALAELGTSTGQQALVDRASNRLVPIDVRQAAASAFHLSVLKHRTLLRADDIIRQYDRYNASETADAETQNVLAYILDVIEAPRKARLNNEAGKE